MPPNLSPTLSRRRVVLPAAVAAAALVILTAVGLATYRPWAATPSSPAAGPIGERPRAQSPFLTRRAQVTLTQAQQAAIGLTEVAAAVGPATEVVEAPGQVVPDESKFAYITPRAAGLVRKVAVHIGQNVRAGDLLALVDSPEVSQARFDYFTRLQELEIARTQAEWQATINDNTLALLDRLKAGDSPEEIHRRFENRPVGANREQLLTAASSYRLHSKTMERNRQLLDQEVIPRKQFEEVRSAFESAQATYQGLMDQMEYNTRLATVRTNQALRRADTALRVARERLRVLGVNADGSEPEIKDGRVAGVRRHDTLLSDPIPSQPAGEHAPAPAGPGLDPLERPDDLPVSAYAILAPFDGTVLDRELVVPGIYVDTTHRIFTVADLSTVWIEVAIHESHYGALSRSHDAVLLLTSPAYPGRSFAAEVIYTGDLVDPKSRTVKLLARARNHDRWLKPGMFVEVTMRLQGAQQAILIPEAALLSDGDRRLVFIRTGPTQFDRREVVVGVSDGDQVAILDGVAAGEPVVVQGGFKLKSKAIQVAGAQP